MKKTIALLSAVMALLLAAGCSNDGKTTPSSVPETSETGGTGTAESSASVTDPSETGTDRQHHRDRRQPGRHDHQ